MIHLRDIDRDDLTVMIGADTRYFSARQYEITYYAKNAMH